MASENLVRIREELEGQPNPIRVDEKQAIMYDVKLLGWDSKNNASALEGIPRRQFQQALNKPYGYDRTYGRENHTKYHKLPLYVNHTKGDTRRVIEEDTYN